jgi:gamma-glutamyltranspeptidase/glutathione hydrolase
MLKAGGSAVDAALATNAALAVLEPMMNGPGGDLMALVWDEVSGELVGYNGAGRAPSGLSFAALKAELASRGEVDIPTIGPLSVTVPGAVRGWCDLHARFGKLPFAAVLAPAIALARGGAPVPPVIAAEWAAPRNDTDATSGGHYPAALAGWHAVFGAPPHSTGEVFANPALGDTLAALAAGGCDVFYAPGGAIAEKIVAMGASTGLRISAGDLAAHRGEWVAPVNTSFRGTTLFQLPPNPQGAAALEAMNVLEAFNFSSGEFNSADYLHAHIEAKKLAFADASAYFADPDFVEVPVEGIVSKAYAASQRARINMSSAARTDAPGLPPGGAPRRALRDMYGGDTTYLTAADSSGMMVSWIQSLYTGFGSGLVDPTLGFALQSRGALFSMVEGHPNVYAPGKRPFHTIMPGMAAQLPSADTPLGGGAQGAAAVGGGAPWVLSYGVMGGFMQP